MKKLLNHLALCLSLLCVGHALAADTKSPIQIDKAWARATVSGQSAGGGFLTIRNAGEADELIGGSTSIAARLELHSMQMEGSMMQMRRLDGIAIPAQGSVELKSGGLHLMFMGLKTPLRAGTSIPLILHFRKAGKVPVQMQVQPLGAGNTHSH